MVAVEEHLENAPIQEAVIDFRVRRDDPIAESTFQVLQSALGDAYPTADQLQTRTFEFRVDNPDKPVSSYESTAIGYRYTSADRTYISQFRNDGFTLSRLAPYESWNSAKAEADRLWAIYVRETKPSAITRIAVRYINRIVLQFTDKAIDIEDYFLMVPKVPPELPQSTVSLLSQLKLHDSATGAAANVSISALKFEESGIPVIFDIDVFKGGEFQVNGDESWDFLEKLRELKNIIFFHSITDKTMELFK